MRRFFGCLIFAFFMLTLSSQQVYLRTGKVISSFDYKNSEGNRLSDLSGSFLNSLGLGSRIPVMKSPCNISFEISNDKFGASCSDTLLGNYSEWDVSFLDLNLGVDYEFLRPLYNRNDPKGFSFCLKAAFATDFLIKGKQRLNNQVYDLSGVEEFDKPVFLVKGGVCVNYYITRSYVAFVQYMYGRSFLIGNYTGQEQLRYSTHSISLGFAVNLLIND
jgi:hypothetical protein